MTWVWPGPLRVSEVQSRNTCYKGGFFSEGSLLSSSPMSFYLQFLCIGICMYQFIILFIKLEQESAKTNIEPLTFLPYISSKGGKPDDVLGICLRAKRVGFSSTSQSKGFSSDSLTKIFCIVWLHFSTSPCDWGC